MIRFLPIRGWGRPQLAVVSGDAGAKPEGGGWSSATAGLGRRSLSGGIWVLSSQGITQILFTIRTIVAARCLAPADFGVFGIAAIVYGLFELFLTTGFKAALIQKQGSIEKDMDTVWTLELIRGIGIFLVLMATAPWLAAFFNGQDARQGAAAIRTMAVLFLVQGLANIAVINFERAMQFRKFFWMNSLSTFAEFATTIALALILRSFWALLLGQLLGNVVRCILSYVMIPERPRWEIDWDRAKALFGFSKWVLFSVLVGFLCTQGDSLAVGRMLDVKSLGIYQMAATISSLPMTQIAGIIGRVAFPAFSSIQGDIERLRRAYLKTLGIILALVVPVTVSIYALAPEFTAIFLGEKWQAAAPVISVLVFAGLLRPLISLVDTVFSSVGRPMLGMGMQVVRLATLAATLIPLGTANGLPGIALAVFASNLVPLVIFSIILSGNLGLRLPETGKPLLRAILLGGIMAGVFLGFKAGVRVDGAFLFALCAVTGWGAYGLLTWVTQRAMCRELIDSARGRR